MQSPRTRTFLSVVLFILIFLFVAPGDVSQLVSEEIVQTSYKIILQDGEHSIELQGLEIKNYCEISLDTITQKFFFVIHKI